LTACILYNKLLRQDVFPSNSAIGRFSSFLKLDHGISHSGIDQSGIDESKIDQSGIDQGQIDQSGIDQR
jgi:hypothetical protein